MKKIFFLIIVIGLISGLNCGGDKNKNKLEVSNSTNKLMADGIQKYRDKDYEGAMKKWEELLKLDPDNEQAKKYINRVKWQLENKDKEK